MIQITEVAGKQTFGPSGPSPPGTPTPPEAPYKEDDDYSIITTYSSLSKVLG